MKILQINNVYRYGSTGKITADIHQELLRRGVESRVYYGRQSRTQDAGVYKICSEAYGKMQNALSRLTGVMYGGCVESTNRLIRAIRREKPDVVHLQCLNGYFVNIYRLVTFLKKQSIPTVLTLHAEFMHTANCGHALDCTKWLSGCGHCPRLRQETLSLLVDGTAKSFRKMQQAFDGFDRLIVASVSPWLKERAEQSPILRHKQHTVVLNGLDVSVFHPSPDAALRSRLGIDAEQRVVLHVTPDFSLAENHLKGGRFVVEMAARMPETLFLVAGPCAGTPSMPPNVRLLGRIRDQKELAALYTLADAVLLTSQRETFSMVCAESLCCGTPVAGFMAGAPEMIALPAYAAFVPYGDADGLEKVLQQMLHTAYDRAAIALEAQAVYDRSRMIDAYCALYDAVLKKEGTHF